MFIAADDIGANEIAILTSASQSEISTAIINYVAQTNESLILNDAVNDGEFFNDPDVIAQQIKSVLCVPLLEQDFSGVLSLENNSLVGAFTPREKTADTLWTGFALCKGMTKQ